MTPSADVWPVALIGEKRLTSKVVPSKPSEPGGQFVRRPRIVDPMAGSASHVYVNDGAAPSTTIWL